MSALTAKFKNDNNVTYIKKKKYKGKGNITVEDLEKMALPEDFYNVMIDKNDENGLIFVYKAWEFYNCLVAIVQKFPNFYKTKGHFADILLQDMHDMITEVNKFVGSPNLSVSHLYTADSLLQNIKQELKFVYATAWNGSVSNASKNKKAKIYYNYYDHEFMINKANELGRILGGIIKHAKSTPKNKKMKKVTFLSKVDEYSNFTVDNEYMSVPTLLQEIDPSKLVYENADKKPLFHRELELSYDPYHYIRQYHNPYDLGYAISNYDYGYSFNNKLSPNGAIQPIAILSKEEKEKMDSVIHPVIFTRKLN